MSIAPLATSPSACPDRLVEMPHVRADLAVEAMSNTHTFTCELCGGTFDSDQPDEAAHAEAVRLWGRRGDAGEMGVVCENCFQDVMAWWRAELAARRTRGAMS